jgi:transposase
MAYGAGFTGSNQTTSRAVTLGYGLDDIQRAREATERTGVLNRFTSNKKFQNLARSLPGQFNQRGMIDSGLRQRARERLAAQKQLEQYGLAAQTAEAQAQLDRQRALLEEQFGGGLMDDTVADALRRFGIAQTIQGLVG